ncbi:MAG: hypothetical protein V3V97_10265 [Hyphomicrobiaceae bacterium]
MIARSQITTIPPGGSQFTPRFGFSLCDQGSGLNPTRNYVGVGLLIPVMALFCRRASVDGSPARLL